VANQDDVAQKQMPAFSGEQLQVEQSEEYRKQS
jgi:hypothetical protein